MEQISIIMCIFLSVHGVILHPVDKAADNNMKQISEWKLSKDRTNNTIFFFNNSDSGKILKNKNVYALLKDDKLEFWFDYSNKLRSADGATIFQLKKDLITFNELKYTIKQDNQSITVSDKTREILKLNYISAERKIIINKDMNSSVDTKIVDFLLLKLCAKHLEKISDNDDFSNLFWSMTFFN